jgi:flagellum-specific peptidoglycan hydrolase FlgJ
MKRIFYILVLFVLPFKLLAQGPAQVTLDYINMYKGIAIKEMKRTGVPASITLAQAIVESGSGESNLAKKANNHFGIKCKTEWTGEKIYQDDDERNECFRVYPNADSSFIDHSNFLKYRPYYASLFELDPVDDTAWAYGLKKAGYATEKDYPTTLLKVIDLYELSQYNFPELEEEDSISTAKDTVVKVVTIKDTVEKIVVVKDTVIKIVKDTVFKTTPLINNTISKDTAFKVTTEKEVLVNYPVNKKFKINQVPAIWAAAGRSLIEIASTYNIMLFKLFQFNEMNEQDIVQRDQLLFLNEKKKESNKKIHIVKKGENLYDISQAEGIQLKALQSYNPLATNENIKEGATLYLFNMPKDQINTTTTDKNSKDNTPKKINKFKLF